MSNKASTVAASGAVTNPYSRSTTASSTTASSAPSVASSVAVTASARTSSTGTAATLTSAAASSRTSRKSPVGKKDTASFLHRYLANFACSLPKIDKGGLLYKAKEGFSGKASSKPENRTTYFQDPDPAVFGIGPSRPIVTIAPPHQRALERHGSLTKIWTAQDMAAAAEEFEIPRGTEFFVMYPELLDRDVLRSLKLWKRGLDGFCCPCPHCKSNLFVSVESFNVQEFKGGPRSIVRDDEKMRTFIIAPVYKCEAPAHQKERKEACRQKTGSEVDFKTKAKKTWQPFTGEGWRLLPESIKDRYDAYFCRLDEGGSTLYHPSLIDGLLDDKVNFSEMETELERKYEKFETMCIKDWSDFVAVQSAELCNLSDDALLKNTLYQSLPSEQKKEEAKKLRDMKWPSLNMQPIESLFGPPKTTALELMFDKAYAIVEPYLRRDLYSQYGGRILRWDGVYAPAKKTIDDPETDLETNVLLFLQGEHGNYLLGEFAAEESSENWQRIVFLYYQRALKMWGKTAVDAMIAAYSDTCCEGNADPTDHWICKLFPNCPRAPLKDLFHGTKLITDVPTTHGGKHPMHLPFCRGVRDAVLVPYEPHLEENVAHYLKENPKVKSRTAAVYAVSNSSSYKSRMSNYVKGSSDRNVAIEMRSLLRTTAAEDNKNAAAAALKGEYYHRYIKSDGPDGTLGTEKQMENFLVHHDKGCFNDPFCKAEMFYEVAPPKSGRSKTDKRREVVKLRGTNVTERGNRSKNDTVAHLSRQGEKRSNQRLLLFMTKQNNRVEHKVEHLPGRLPGNPGVVKAKPRDWYIREALQERTGLYFSEPMIDLSVLPRKLEGDLAGYEEPIGTQFGKWIHWEKTMAEFDRICNTACSAIEAAAVAPQQVDSDNSDIEGYGDALEEQDCVKPPSLPLFPEKMSASGNSSEGGVLGFSYGGQKWSKGKVAPTMQPAQYLYTGLPANGQLNEFQRVTIYRCMAAVAPRFGSSKRDGKWCNAVAEEWNRLHVEMDLSNPGCGGIGGCITVNHILAFLKAEGEEIVSAKLGVKPSPVAYYAAKPFALPSSSPHAFLPPRQMPPIHYEKAPVGKKAKIFDRPLPDGYDKVSNVDKWSTRDLNRILAEFGETQRGLEKEKKERLRKRLNKK